MTESLPAEVSTQTTGTTTPQIKTVRRKQGNRWLLPGLIVGSLVVTTFALLRPHSPTAVPVNVVKAKITTLVKTVNGTGTARAEVSRTVSFSGTGTVAEVNVKVGDEVQAGQTLARLDTVAAGRDLEAARASVRAAEADLARAQATAREGQLDMARQVQSASAALASARAALADAERTLGLQRDLLNAGAVSQQEVRTTQTARNDAARKVQSAQEDLAYNRSRGSGSGQAGIAQAQAALETARVRVQNLEKSLADATLRAPTSGVVSAVNVTAGNLPPATESAFEITDPDRLYLEVPFDETRAPDLRVGQPAQVEFDALPTQTLTGTVSRVEPVAKSSGQAASVLVRVRLQDARDVKPGFTGTATVTTRRLRDTVTLPLETMREEGGKTKVWRVKPEDGAGTGTAQPVTVTVEDRNANVAAVEGVKSGDLIVTPSPGELMPGVTVRYTEAASGPAATTP